jgi:hypothetical protein
MPIMWCVGCGGYVGQDPRDEHHERLERLDVPRTGSSAIALRSRVSGLAGLGSRTMASASARIRRAFLD